MSGQSNPAVTIPAAVLHHPPLHCSIHCIIPPHMLESIVKTTSVSRERLTGLAKKKADARIQRALTNLGLTNTFSHARSVSMNRHACLARPRAPSVCFEAPERAS